MSKVTAQDVDMSALLDLVLQKAEEAEDFEVCSLVQHDKVAARSAWEGASEELKERYETFVRAAGADLGYIPKA